MSSSEAAPKPVIQDWVQRLSFMQQTVLLSAIRGCDGLPKRHKAKAVVKWFRRCLVISAFDGKTLTDPWHPGGGSFTGPLAEEVPQNLTHDEKCYILQKVADNYVDSRDEMPAHYQVHFMHAVEIMGYKHPDLSTREYWAQLYDRLAKAYHLWPESEVQMDARLGDSEEGWKARNDSSTSCSD